MNPQTKRTIIEPRRLSQIEAIAIGASAGAIEALSTILPALPSTYSLPILIVVHLPPDKNSIMAQLFAAKCKMRVKEAEDKEPIVSGTVYFGAPDYHLLVEANRHLSLSCDEPVLYSRPSIDVLFESAADAYGSGLMGIILTGANSDGAAGLKAVCDAGGLGLVQRPESAEASLMPRSAIEKCPDALPVELSDILSLMLALPHRT